LHSVSVLIASHAYTTDIYANGKAIKIDAKSLRAAFDLDTKLGFDFMSALAKALMLRLNDARAQITAAQ
jgi:hypothetical protein